MNYEELMEATRLYAKYELMKQELLNRYSEEEKEAYEQGQKDLMNLGKELDEVQKKYKEADAFNQLMSDQLKGEK